MRVSVVRAPFAVGFARGCSMGNEQGCNERIETPESTSPTTGPVAWVSKQVKKKQTRNRLLHMLRRSERLMWMEVAVSKDAGAEYPVCSGAVCSSASADITTTAAAQQPGLVLLPGLHVCLRRTLA